jgi:hypothetical protein
MAYSLYRRAYNERYVDYAQFYRGFSDGIIEYDRRHFLIKCDFGRGVGTEGQGVGTGGRSVGWRRYEE